MREANIFLLDLDPSSTACSTLGEILYSAPNMAVQLRQESVKEGEFAPYDGQLCRWISSKNIDLMFIILPPKRLAHNRTFIQSMISEILDTPIMVLIEGYRPHEMFALLELGVADFITPPLTAIDILPRLWRLLEHGRKEQSLMYKLKEKLGLKEMIGESPVFLKEIKKIPIVAKCDASVLITGKTGTGKEMFARAIHYISPRASKPFIAVNCGAIPNDLFENELFGHVQGAFTGAAIPQPGLIREANTGTLFLDDIDCLPALSQIKLLRFLQEKEYRQLGSAKTCLADVRVMAATNADLAKAMAQGKIRQDLYYRLNIISLTLPSLQERQEDIPLLANHFVQKYAIEFGKKVAGIDASALKMLMLYNWPGNVRELEHVIERAVLFTEHSSLSETDIYLPLKKTTPCIAPFKEAKADIVNKFEEKYIKSLLVAYQGNITRAAKAAQKNRRAFWQLMQKHKINVEKVKP